MKALLLYCITFGLYNQAILAPLHFVTPGSLIFDRMIDFHDFIMIYLIFIFVIFSWFLLWSIILYRCYKYLYFIFLIVKLFFMLIEYLRQENISDIRDIPVYFKKFYGQILIYFLGTDKLDNRSELLYVLKYIYKSLAISAQKDFNLEIRRKVHAPWLEIVWTVVPSFILLLIAIPSLYLLYMMDAVEPLSLAVKVIGHQWYWSYEIGCSSPLFKSINTATYTSFDSYLILDHSKLRLLTADNALFVPAGIPLTFLVTSTDVIHSWAVPSLGIKVDAIPGRLNQVCITVFDVNLHYGQCSELCGINHGFMPINIISYVDRVNLLKNKIK